MDEVLQQFKSPSFWFLAVLLGLALNVLAAYLVRSLDQGRSRLARLWKTRSEKARQAFGRDVAALRGNDSAQAGMLVRENRWRLHSIQGWLFVVFLFQLVMFLEMFASRLGALGSAGWVQVALMLLGFAVMLVAGRSFDRAARFRSLVSEAQRLDLEEGLQQARQRLATADRPSGSSSGPS